MRRSKRVQIEALLIALIGLFITTAASGQEPAKTSSVTHYVRIVTPPQRMGPLVKFESGVVNEGAAAADVVVKLKVIDPADQVIFSFTRSLSLPPFQSAPDQIELAIRCGLKLGTYTIVSRMAGDTVQTATFNVGPELQLNCN